MKDVERLVLEYQKERKDEIFREILKENEGLLRLWVYEYNNLIERDLIYSVEDLMEEGQAVLWRAVLFYDPERSVKFASFLKVVVKQHFDRLYTNATRKKRRGLTPLSWEDLVEINRERGSEGSLEAVEVKCFLDGLEDERLQYIAVSLLQGCTKGFVARRLGISNATLSYHVRRLQRLVTGYID